MASKQHLCESIQQNWGIQEIIVAEAGINLVMLVKHLTSRYMVSDNAFYAFVPETCTYFCPKA